VDWPEPRSAYPDQGDSGRGRKGAHSKTRRLRELPIVLLRSGWAAMCSSKGACGNNRLGGAFPMERRLEVLAEKMIRPREVCRCVMSVGGHRWVLRHRDRRAARVVRSR
jgi:hypothetical protein